MMAGGADLEALSHELEAASQEGEAGEGLAEAAELFRAEVDEG
jgi:hypothetical protein